MKAPITPDAARFGLRLLLWAAPLLLAVAVMEAALWGAGETIPIVEVLARQTHDPRVLWLRGRLDQGQAPYKWMAYQALQPRIIAIGSSRVMKFRREMFGRDAPGFLNLGLLATNVYDLNVFADALDTSALSPAFPPAGAARARTPARPRVALVGVDCWWLNGHFNKQRKLPLKSPSDAALDWRAHWTAWRDLLRLDAFLPDITHDHPHNSKLARATLSYVWNAWRAPQTPHALGVQARVLGRGFRSDGSYRAGNVVPFSPAQWKIADDQYWKLVVRGEEEMAFTPGISRVRLALLRHALKTLQRKGFLVLVFNPPLISADAHLMESTPRQRNFWRGYQTLVPRLCRELKIPFCDASTPQALGLTDASMSDAIHAEETLHLYVLRAWLKDPRLQKALPDASRVVEAAIKSKRTGIWTPDFGSASSASSFVGKRRNAIH